MMKYRFRLSLKYLIFVAFVCFVLALSICVDERIKNRNRINEIFKVSLVQLSENLALSLKVGDAAMVNRLSSQTILARQTSYFSIASSNKAVFVRTGNIRSCPSMTALEAPVIYNKKQVGTIKICFKMPSLLISIGSFFIILLGTFLLFGVSLFLIIIQNRSTKPFLLFLHHIDSIDLNALNFPSVPPGMSKHTPVNDLYVKMNNLLEKLQKSQQHNLKIEKEQTYLKVAKQVSHDIRSPLSALSMVSKEISNLPEETRMILRASINRIQDIANNLLQEKIKNKEKEINKPQVYLLAPIIEEVVSEKRTILRPRPLISVEILPSDSYGDFVKVDQSHMKRVLSNLINNSIEAFTENKGEVRISYKRENNNIKIIISDNGKGIPEHIISKLGREGSSFGKEKNSESGSGLGLFHTVKSLEKWNGTLQIDSTEGKGTTLILTLPSQKKPSWFISKLKIIKKQTFVVVDDDESIHQIWNKRLLPLSSKYDIKVIHLTAPDDLRRWIKENGSQEITYLCDFEFIGSNENGLDLIEAENIAKDSILITSHYEEGELRNRCNRLGVKLIPKMMAAIVPIKTKF